MKKVSSEKFKKRLYSACALGLCVTALAGFWIANKDNLSEPVPDAESSTAIGTTDSNLPANEQVTGVKDERYTVSETEASAVTESRTAYFSNPLENGIIKGFSNGELVKNQTTGDWRTHSGADYKGVEGDPVKAIYSGTVTAVRNDPLWGTVVTVEHTQGITAEYRGLKAEGALQPGTEVKINDTLGALGTIPIEKAEGAHLHLEIYQNGKAVSPSLYTGRQVEL